MSDAKKELRNHSIEHLVYGKKSAYNKTISPSLFYSNKFEVSFISLLSSLLLVAADHAKTATKLKKSLENLQLQGAIKDFNDANAAVSEDDNEFSREHLNKMNQKLQEARDEIINTRIKDFDADWQKHWERPSDFFLAWLKNRVLERLLQLSKNMMRSRKKIYI